MRMSKNNDSILEEMRRLPLPKAKDEHEANAERDKLVKLRDLLRDVANIIDEILLLDEREDNGEDVGKELEAAMGRFIWKMVKLQILTETNLKDR